MNDIVELVPVAVANFPMFWGVDIGGTAIKLGLVDSQGQVISFDSIPTNVEQGPMSAIRRVANLIQRVEQREGVVGRIAALGLGTPGTMDIPSGYLLQPPNLTGWERFPIRDALAKATGHSITFANDGAAAAYGEYWLGTGKAFPSIVMLTLGTGVGGGIILGDLSVDGEHSHGAECGHIIVDSAPDARRCSCGQLGHLEAYSSATAVIQRARQALEAGRVSSIANSEELSGLDVARAAESGDSLAREVVLEAADYLACGIVSLVHTIDPAAVILGGAMNFGGASAALGREFLGRVRSGFQQRTFPVLARKVVIDFAGLGGDAGFLGAAGLARSAHARRPGPAVEA